MPEPHGSLEVSCIKKRDHKNPHERITHIGGMTLNGVPWRMTEEQAIRQIDTDTRQFFVKVNSRRVDVEVAEHEGRKYLKTKADGYAPNNLLSLPECPV